MPAAGRPLAAGRRPQHSQQSLIGVVEPPCLVAAKHVTEGEVKEARGSARAAVDDVGEGAVRNLGVLSAPSDDGGKWAFGEDHWAPQRPDSSSSIRHGMSVSGTISEPSPCLVPHPAPSWAAWARLHCRRLERSHWCISSHQQYSPGFP